MLQNLFKLRPATALRTTVLPAPRRVSRLVRPRRRAPRTEPTLRARLAAREWFDTVFGAMRDGRGVHVESLLCALAAVAGHACQATARAELIDRRGLTERQVFVVVGTADGGTYYAGETIDRSLFDEPLALWRMVGDTAQSLGVAELPLPASLVAQSAMQFGHASFGEPAWPLGHRAGDTPFNYLQALWTPFRRIADRHGAHALDWPVIGALALQRAILASAQALEPALALRLVLGTAVPMSRVHLASTATGKGAESPKPPVPQR